jgi:hypothetical protein
VGWDKQAITVPFQPTLWSQVTSHKELVEMVQYPNSGAQVDKDLDANQSH